MQKLTNQFSQNLVERWHMGHGNHLNFGGNLDLIALELGYDWGCG